MGFRSGAYATVWTVEQTKETVTRGRISISRKNKETGNYEDEFSGFVSFIGTVAATNAAKLHERDRIKLGDVDVTNRYDKETQKEYTYYKIFSFDPADAPRSGGAPQAGGRSFEPRTVESNDIEDDNDLPF